MPNHQDSGIERRTISYEVRLEEGEDGSKRIVGYGAVFNQMSENLGGFREMILPGAFADVLDDDVRSLFNHDPNLILGRTVSNTMEIEEDDVGLRYAVDPPDTEYARSLQVSIERGDVDQSSFGFRVLEESWRRPTDDEPLPVRIIHKFERLYDAGPVTFPAYTTTSVSVRALDKAKEMMTSDGGATGEDDDDQRAGGRLALKRRRLELAEKL